MEIMHRNLGMVIVALLSAIACGATFLLGLYRQFALVEVAASIATGIEVYFLSSSIGDMLEDKEKINNVKLVATIALAASIVAYFLITKLRAN